MGGLPRLPLFLRTFLPSDVASRKLLSRHVIQQSTTEFVISDPAVAESLALCLSGSPSLGEILVVIVLLGRGSAG